MSDFYPEEGAHTLSDLAKIPLEAHKGDVRPEVSDYANDAGSTSVMDVAVVDDSKLKHKRLVAHNMRLARAEKGWTQGRAAAAFPPDGKDRQHYNAWENARTEPGPGSKRKLEQLFDKPYGWFDQPHDEESWRQL